MTLLLKLSDFRQLIPTNAVVEDASIASAIYDAQIGLIPAITSWDYFNALITAVETNALTPEQIGFLRVVTPALAHYAAIKLCALTANQIFPTKVSGGATNGSQAKLSGYHRAQTSIHLRPVYAYCEEKKIKYNIFKSTEVTGIVFGGWYNR